MALYWPPVTVVPLAWKWTNRGPVELQKIFNITFSDAILIFWQPDRIYTATALFISYPHSSGPSCHHQSLCNSEKHVFHHNTTADGFWWLPDVLFAPLSVGLGLILDRLCGIAAHHEHCIQTYSQMLIINGKYYTVWRQKVIFPCVIKYMCSIESCFK